MSNYQSVILVGSELSLAVRSARQFTLSVTATNATYTLSPQKSVYTPLDTITITITPSEGYTVSGGVWDKGAAEQWTAPINGDSATFKVTQNTSISFTAAEIIGEEPPANMTTYIEKDDIRWDFDEAVEYGYFANGDPYVIGPVNVVGITPASHLTEPGELDANGVSYPSARTIGSGTWNIFNASGYNRAEITTSDTTGLTVDGWCVCTGATGINASKVNGFTFEVSAINPNTSFTISEGVARRFSLGDNMVGGTFGGAIINGSMINPPIESGTHAYTTGDGNGWTPSLNVAWGVSEQNPLTVPVNSSLISTESKQDTGSGNRSSVRLASILTVLPSDAFDELPEGVEPSDCFRPSYYGTTKPIRHWKQQLSYAFLGSLTPVTEAWPGIPTLAAMEDRFRRPWISKAVGFTRFIRPANNMPDYWVQMATNDGALVLNLNHTNQQKEMLLIYYTQLGIDLYGAFEAGSYGNWPDGGIYSGLLLPILTAGKALDYAPMLALCEKAGDYALSEKVGGGNYNYGDLPSDYIYLSELDQTYYVSQLSVDITTGQHSIPWRPSGYALSWTGWQENGGAYGSYGSPFSAGDIGLPEYGIRHATHPGYSAKLWDVYKDYRSLNTPHEIQTAFLLLVMGLKIYVNHDALFDYTDRASVIYGETNMRKTYRANYGDVWEESE
jgi:hypothetical protein